MKFKSTKQAKKAHSGIFRKFSPFMPILPIKKAFTLAELLMATLVMSIILTALAPVMTKRSLDNVNIGQSRNEKDGKLFLYNSMTTGILNNYGSSAPIYNRYSFTIPSGVYSIDVYVQSAGGAGGDASVPDVYDRRLVPPTTSYRQSTSRTLTTVKGMYDFKIKEIVGAGGGGGGGKSIWGAGPDSQEQCDSITSNLLYVPRSYNGGNASACVTRRNVGDPGGPPINTNGDCFKIVQAPTDHYTNVNPGYCQDYVCFRGYTARYSTSIGGYSGARTVCSQPVARYSCDNYRPNSVQFYMPTAKQAQGWLNYQIGYSGLDLCTNDGLFLLPDVWIQMTVTYIEKVRV